MLSVLFVPEASSMFRSLIVAVFVLVGISQPPMRLRLQTELGDAGPIYLLT